MATGYAKSTGRLGVCLATSGPGAIHLLNGLYDAKLDHVPVLALTGMQESQMLGTGYQQEVALEKLFMDVAEYNEMIRVPPRCRPWSTWPSATPWRRRGVAHLTIPTDIQIADADANPWDAPAPAVIKPTAPIFLPAPGRARHVRPRGGGRGPERGQQGGHAGRAPEPCTPEPRCWPSPKRSAARSSRRCRARPSSPTTTRSPSAGSVCSAPRPPWMPWRGATPSSWSGPTSRTRSTCPSPGRARSCRSRPIPSGPATGSPPTFR